MEGSYNKVKSRPFNLKFMAPIKLRHQRWPCLWRESVDYVLNVFLTLPNILSVVIGCLFEQVFRARKNIPAQSYEFFMKILLRTIRSLDIIQLYAWIYMAVQIAFAYVYFTKSNLVLKFKKHFIPQFLRRTRFHVLFDLIFCYYI